SVYTQPRPSEIISALSLPRATRPAPRRRSKRLEKHASSVIDMELHFSITYYCSWQPMQAHNFFKEQISNMCCIIGLRTCNEMCDFTKPINNNKYIKLNQATHKDHFPLPFLDQVLDKLAGKSHYCFLDGYSRYMQIHIAPEDQHKTTFTYPFGTFAYTRMSFGLCNAPSTFQRCMLSIFSNLLEDCMEVFMDNFIVYVNTFDARLGNLARVLKRCIETDLVLSFEKCHFMVVEGIVLGHLVDKAKIEIITSLPNPTSMREVLSFLGHAGFYRRFIKNFNKTALPLSKLLQKDVKFVFKKECIQAFEELKTRLTSTPILQEPNWELPFELMCDASNSALGVQDRVGGPAHIIAYASQTMDQAQINYTTIEKELLAIVFTLDKFRSYLLGSRVIEFDLEIGDKKGADNAVADHLSWIEHEFDPMPIRNDFPDEQLLRMDTSTPWFANMCNFIVASQFPLEASQLYKEKIKSDAKYYIWDNPYLWKRGSDHVIRRCIPDSEISSILHFLSCNSWRRPSWINSNSSKGIRLWVLLAHQFSRHPPIRLDLRAMPASRNSHESPT
ncbi:Retrovirus-related Pol polyprotein from transposon 17.6, partial [Mucuna pruriens]